MNKDSMVRMRQHTAETDRFIMYIPHERKRQVTPNGISSWELKIEEVLYLKEQVDKAIRCMAKQPSPKSRKVRLE